MWVPGYVGIRGNEAADRAAKKALVRKTDSRCNPLWLTGLKAPTN